ncbi:cytochrome D1 domain-containing protein [Halobacteriales archaeon Cl-PHB]
MAHSNTQAAEDDHQDRVKRHLSASRSVARDLDYEGELNFAAGLPSADRRTLLKATGAVAAAGALAGCPMGGAPSNDGDATPAGTQEPQPTETKQAEKTKTVKIEAHQYEFKPQQIQVEPNTEVTLQFTQSTFQKDDNYSIHSFYLAEPYDIGPIELPKNTDPDVDKEVTFVADQTGSFQFECATYCGTQHAAMKGELVVTDEGGHAHELDYTKLKDIQSTHKQLMKPGDLPQEAQHDVDLRDLMVVTERENASVSMVDTINNENLGRVEDVGKAIHVHDFHPKLGENGREGAFVYTQSREGWMWKVDLFGFNRVAGIRAGTDARKITVSRDGNYVVGGFYNPNHLLIADAETMEPLKRIPTHTVNPDGNSVGSRVCAIHDVPSQGLWAVALKEGGEVWLVDYTSEDFPVVATIDVGRILHDAYFTTGDRYFWIASQEDNIMGVVDTHEMELAAELESEAVPHPGGPFSRAEDAGYAWTIHAGAPAIQFWDYEPPWDRVKTLETPGKGLFSAAHDDSSKIWGDVLLESDRASNRVIFQVDKNNLEITNKIDTGKLGDWNSRSLHSEFSRDGSKVFVSLWDAGNILVFDSESGEHLETIEGFNTPTGKFLGRRYEEHHVE